MKHIYCIFLSLFFLNFFCTAQENIVDKILNDTPTTFLTVGLGINHTGVLSIGVDIPVSDEFSAFLDLGSGGWGIKFGIGGSYYFNSIQKGSVVSLAFYRASGSADNPVTILNEAGDEIPVFLNPVGTINATYTYSVKLAKRSKLAMVAGFAVGITDKESAYETTVLNLTFDDFSKQFINILHPDGLILGLKFMIGIGRR